MNIPQFIPGRSLRVVRALEQELMRQLREGLLCTCSTADSMGRADVAGTLDLAALADATEVALRKELRF